MENIFEKKNKNEHNIYIIKINIDHYYW